MQNFVNFANNALVTSNTTFAVAQPNLPPPASLVVASITAGITITLPNTNSTPPVLPPASPGYGQTIDGVGGGFFTSILNQTGSGTVVILPASGDQLFVTTTGAVTAATLSATVGARATFEAYPGQTTWYQIA